MGSEWEPPNAFRAGGPEFGRLPCAEVVGSCAPWFLRE